MIPTSTTQFLEDRGEKAKIFPFYFLLFTFYFSLSFFAAQSSLAKESGYIDIGSRRELFVDHYLIDSLDGVRLKLHHPRDEGPVLKFDKPWEGPFCGYVTVIKDQDKYRFYYRGLPQASRDGSSREVTCYAESSEGIYIVKPKLNLFAVKGSGSNNVILAGAAPVHHNFSPFLDTRPGVPEEQRFKALGGTQKSGLIAYVSADGVRWKRLREEPVFTKGLFDSQNVSFWSEAEQCYLCYFRTWTGTGYRGFRSVSRAASKDFLNWSEPVEMSFGDTPREHIYTNQTHPYFRAPHIYVSVAARFLPGRQVLSAEEAKRVNVNPNYFKDCSDAVLMTSRGGNVYTRTFMEGFIRPGIGLQNWVSRSNYPALNVVQTGPDEMSLYVQHDYAQPTAHLRRYSLRLDGFASLNAPYNVGSMTTKPLVFSGKQLLLNFATSAPGFVRVEIQDATGKPIPGYSLDEARELIGNYIEHPASWKNGTDVSALAGRPVRLRFVMKDADLYSLRFRSSHSNGSDYEFPKTAAIKTKKTGQLSVTVHESGSQDLLPCRAWVNTGDKRLFNPATESCTSYVKDRSFSCDGQFVIEVPVGKAVIHVERGKEYWPVDKEIVVEPGQTITVDITLKRWINMRKEGWYSADIHCHFGLNDIRLLKQLALADDVNFEPILTLWNHQSPAPPGGIWPDWPGGSSVYADATHLVTLRNQEIERIGGQAFESVGALLMFGLTKPVEMPPRGSRYPCDAVLGRIARETSPQCIIDTDKPIWGENVVGVALGLFDSVQVCHNHYHRRATLQDGRVGWGMAGADIEQRHEDWGQDELFHRTNSTYYRFLNCGFKLAATGGSAMGVMAVPLGYGRTYAKLDGPLTEGNYLDAIRTGRTFATNGPVLILTADGQDSGTEIQYSINNNDSIRIEAELRSIQRIDSLELIYNGKVIKNVSLEDATPSPILKESAVLGLKPLRSGWIVARAIFTSSDGHLRQAHTSPVYITVDGKPTVSKADAEYMIRWIDRLLEVSSRPGRYKSDDERTQTQTIFKEARRIYDNIARMAIRIWGDS